MLKDANILATERWDPCAGDCDIAHRGMGACCGIAAPPGKEGYERFPYLLQALHDLGMQLGLHCPLSLTGSYRSRVDLDYFADRWRKAGIGAIHVSPVGITTSRMPSPTNICAVVDRGLPPQGDHLVYVWLELPARQRNWTSIPIGGEDRHPPGCTAGLA